MLHAPATVSVVRAEADEQEVPLERIEAEITELAGHINAATCRFLLLVAEFDAREGWAGWGTKSCAHWLGWRCGISPETAREQVRVARRLPELPRITGAFRRGELSYSKVRAITRIATADTEETLLMWARHSTGAQTETFVRLYRRCRQTVEAGKGGRRFAQRYLHHRYDDDGMLVIEARLCPEDGAVLLRALELAVESLGEAGSVHTEGVSAATSGNGSVPEQEGVSAAPSRGGWVSEHESVSAETSGGGSVHTGKDVSAETSAGGWVSGHEGVGGETWGDGPKPVDVSAETSAGGWVSGHEGVCPVTSVSAPQDPPTGAALRADALVAMAETMLEAGLRARPGGDRYQVVIHTDMAALGGSPDGRYELDDGAGLAPATARRVGCDASVVGMLEDDGRPLSVGRKSRSVPTHLRRALQARDRGCVWPGCCQKRYTDGHHVRHWADGGATSLDNLVMLCRFHHRLVHEGGYQMTVCSDGAVAFSRPGGDPIPQAPVTRVPGGEELIDLHARLGLAIDSDTALTAWTGERFNYGLASELLLREEGLGEPLS